MRVGEGAGGRNVVIVASANVIHGRALNTIQFDNIVVEDGIFLS